MNTAKHRDDWLDINDVAKMIHVSKQTIDRMWRSGRLPPPVKFTARTIRWSQQVIDSHLEKMKDQHAISKN